MPRKPVSNISCTRILKMPCKCYGVNLNKCDCKLFGYPVKDCDSNIILMTKSDRFRRFHNTTPRNFVARIAENIYEKCAGYNLRYCQLRGFVNPHNCLANAMKDLFILFCFILANSVVLLAILMKISGHIYYFVAVTLQNVKGYLSPKRDPCEVTPATIRQHSYK